MTSDNEIRVLIIKKLVRHNYWGNGHISGDDLVKGQDRRYKDKILEIADNLVREGILIRFPHSKEKHYHLNQQYRKEIYRIIEGL